MAINCCKSYVGKQIIGLLPSQADCLFYYSPNVDVIGWQINGIDIFDSSAINSNLNPYGYYYGGYWLSNNTQFRFIISYIGMQPPSYMPIVTDNNGDTVTYYLTNCCELTCLEGTFNAADFYYFNTGLGYNINVGDSANGFDDVVTINNILKPLYGQQLIYSYTDNGDGTFYIKIDNVYACALTLAWSADDVTYTDMVPCGTPADECMYYATINLGNPNSVNYSDFYLDSAATIPAFDSGINGYNGDGNLRNLLQSLGGDIFGIVCNGGPFDGTFYCHIVGTSTYNVPIYDSVGSLVNGLSFEKATTYGMSCKPNFCYTATIDQPQIRLVTLEIYSYFYLNIDYQFAQSYKYGSLYMDLSDMGQMQEYCNRLYGSTCIYDYKDNGNGTYTIQISNAYNLGAAPIFYVSDGSSYQQVYLNLC